MNFGPDMVGDETDNPLAIGSRKPLAHGPAFILGRLDG
jgi:hypothetical protein